MKRGKKITWKTILDSFGILDDEERETLLSALALREKTKRLLKSLENCSSKKISFFHD